MLSIKQEMEKYWAMPREEFDAMTEEECEEYIDIACEYQEWYQQEGWAEEDDTTY